VQHRNAHLDLTPAAATRAAATCAARTPCRLHLQSILRFEPHDWTPVTLSPSPPGRSSDHNIVSLKYDYVSLKYDYVSLKYDYVSLKYDYVSLKYDFVSLTYDFCEPAA
jgi:hypothetical protein